MFYGIELIFVILTLFLLIFLWHLYSRRRQPPGPLGFPFLGMLPQRLMELILSRWFKETPDIERFRRYKEKYGAIWSEEFGSLRFVTLTTWDVIMEALVENAELFSGRPSNDCFNKISKGKGIIFANGPIWRENRHFAIRSLKDLGMGKKQLEQRICEEADDFIAHMIESDKKNLNVCNVFTKAILNVIVRLVFLDKSQNDDPDLKKYVDNLYKIFHGESASLKITMFPSLFKFDFMKQLFPDVKQFLSANDWCYEYIENQCLARGKLQKESLTPDCVFDCFYRLRFNDSLDLSDEEKRQEIVASIFDLFNAGIDTTINLLTFSCLMLGKYEYIQLDLRNEIKALVDDSKQISIDLRKKCPKFLSFIDEVHRYCVIVPKLHRRVIRKCVFNGYQLSPSDIIFTDAANICHDPGIFDEPKKFNPYRFMDETQTKYVPSKYLMAFGIGKRVCIGESMAATKVFIFLQKIIYHFNISLTKETKGNFDNIIIGHPGIVHAPLKNTMDFGLLN